MPAIRFTQLSCLLLASLLLSSGCAKVREIEYAPAEGKVTLDGTPLQDGIVSFESSDTGFSAMSTLDGDGMFRIEKVPVGKYAVTISPPA
ncbi:MAG TPA: carboxypeptidase-like regulatory domain-containing protein, partial [Caulifigura sp.]|nr:carboxypeptidase-like regulatory domain-containing protein [Caulifigura sp.]